MISLLVTGARMLASQAIKKKAIGAVKKKVVGSAKNFVKGKKGKKKKGSTNVESKGGSLVHSPGKGLTKSASVGSSFIPKGGSIVKSSGGSVAASGDNSFESIRNRFDNIVNLTSQIEAAVETQFNTKKDNQKQIHLENSKEKKKDREEKLESKNNFGGGLIKGIGGAAKGLGIGNFLKNILIGGLALLLLNNIDNIKKGFDSLSKGLTSGWDFLRIAIISLSTVYRKPIKWIIGTGWKVLKSGAKLFKRAFTKLSKVFKFKKIIKAITSFGLKLLKKMTPVGALRNLATRSTSALKRVFNKPTKPANNIRPGPKNLSNAKPKATPKPKGLRLASRARLVFGKQGLKRLSRLGNLFKRIPLIGALLGIGIDLALGEKLDNAIFGALGASLGSAIGAGVGSLILPLAGTFAGGFVGGIVGDWLGKQLYKSMKGSVSGLFGFKDGKNTSDNKNNNTENNNTENNNTENSDPGLYEYKEYDQEYNEPHTIVKVGDNLHRVNSNGAVGGEPVSPERAKLIIDNQTGELKPTYQLKYKPGEYKIEENLLNPTLTQVLKSGDGPVEGQIKRVTNQRGKVTWKKWKQDSTGRWSWWSQTGPHAVQAQEDYTKQQLAPQPVATKADVTPSGSTTTSNYLKKGDMVSGYPITSPYGPRWGRTHGGLDIGTPVGTYVAFTENAEILYTGHYGGYGYLIDVWLPNAKVQLRLAHLSEILVNKGDRIPARTSVGRTGGMEGHPGAGSSTGPHLHIEADTVKGRAAYGANTGEGDPSKYMKYLILSRTGGDQVTPSGDSTSLAQTSEVRSGNQGRQQSAQLQSGGGHSSAGQSASAVSSHASYEGGLGNGNVVVALPGGGQVQGQVVGGGGSSPTLIVDTKSILNRYYKAQLLGFLYKQG